MFRNKDLLNLRTVQIIHEKCKERAVNIYDYERKLSPNDDLIRFKRKLDEDIDEFYFNNRSNMVHQFSMDPELLRYFQSKLSSELEMSIEMKEFDCSLEDEIKKMEKIKIVDNKVKTKKLRLYDRKHKQQILKKKLKK
ncbi:hypothetical protein ACKWTF_015700 [Chironomus riparius]